MPLSSDMRAGMNVTLRTPLMTREQFLDWVERQEAPFEFDGYEPVSMTGGNKRHGQHLSSILLLRSGRASESRLEVLPEAGVATVGDAVRYPDTSCCEPAAIR